MISRPPFVPMTPAASERKDCFAVLCALGLAALFQTSPPMTLLSYEITRGQEGRPRSERPSPAPCRAAATCKVGRRRTTSAYWLLSPVKSKSHRRAESPALPLLSEPLRAWRCLYGASSFFPSLPTSFPSTVRASSGPHVPLKPVTDETKSRSWVKQMCM